MSQDGETLSSSFTRLSVPSTSAAQLPENQQDIIDKCTSIVQDFRAGRISKPKASILLQQSIPRDESSEDQFLSIYEPYFDMLNNFERYQKGNVRRIDGVQQHITESSPDKEDNANSQPTSDAVLVRPSKQPRSPSSEDEDNEYEKRTHLDFSLLPWNELEESNLDSTSNYPHLYRKPTLCLRISLATLSARNRHCSTVTDLSPSFPKQSGSTCSAGMPSTSTMCSPTFTWCPTTQKMLLNLEGTLSYFMDHPPLLQRSRLTEIGSSRGTAWSMLQSLCSNTENRNSKHTESISSNTSLPYHPSCIPESSIMTEPVESGWLSDETLSSPTSLSSVLYPPPHIPSGSDQSDQIPTIPIKFQPFQSNSNHSNQIPTKFRAGNHYFRVG